MIELCVVVVFAQVGGVLNVISGSDRGLSQDVGEFCYGPITSTRRSSKDFVCRSGDFLDCCSMWDLGKFGCMEDTPTGCANDLPAIRLNFKKDPTSNSETIVSSDWIWTQAVHFRCQHPKLRPVHVVT